MTDDPYRTVTATFRGMTPHAIFIDRPNATDQVSIPRSLIHGVDDKRFDALFAGEKITFRLFAWKAEDVGLA